jgi:hypothetical protein
VSLALKLGPFEFVEAIVCTTMRLFGKKPFSCNLKEANGKQYHQKYFIAISTKFYDCLFLEIQKTQA